ncbi:E3 ubiquitin-protein ligase [Saccharomycopsis crataegensis]|uniref:HECT-type E3 ubiquitin transferase n=1 Tax=Saccharomycopsis crataegensis TaxID=43959 RepID=A0AAV5QJ87_9ASCO|nr:E3 ubiquitin-protein ligase [Saccharomycopsis crataegensis]
MIIGANRYDMESKLVFAKELAAKPLESLITEINNNLLPIIVKFNGLQFWVPLLNRFDEILKDQVEKYGLSEQFPKLHEISSDDDHIIVSVLKFTEILLNHCSGKTLYSSHDRLFDILMCSSVNVKYHVLRIITLIANRIAKRKSLDIFIPYRVKGMLALLSTCVPAYSRHSEKNDERYDLLDILKNEKKIPSKWSRLEFQYFKSSSESHSHSLTSDPERQASSKTYKAKNKAQKRDATATPQQSKSKKLGKKKSQKQTVVVDGLCNFNLSQEELQKLSIQQIYDKASKIIPFTYLPKFSVQLSVAKSFNSQSFDCLQLREKWVQVKIIAHSCNMLINNSRSLADEQEMAEKDLKIISSIIELIKPQNQETINPNVYADSMFTLAAISGKREFRNELLKLLSGNVSHGLLFQILKSIQSTVKVSDETISVKELSLQDNKFEETKRAYVWFLQVVENLSDLKVLGTTLVSAGLLNQLMEFLPLRSEKYKGIIICAISILKSIVTSNLRNLDPFITKEGFRLLIEAIGEQVEHSLKSQAFFGDLNYIELTTKNFNSKRLDENDLGVRVIMKERDYGYTRSLMKFAYELIRTDSGDRMRNFFDSPLLTSFNKILLNAKIFNPKILTSVLGTITTIIHNEPTSFPILLESGTIDTVLDNVESLFLPDGYLILSLPEIMGSFCLNKTGLQKVQETGVITKFFETFRNVKIAKVLVNDEISTAIASAFDELGRHYSDLKPEIIKATNELITSIPGLVSPRMKGVEFYKSPRKKSLYYDENEPVDYQEDGFGTLVEDVEDDLFIMENAANFIYTAIFESHIWSGIYEEVKNGSLEFEKWLPFLIYNRAPYDHLNSSFYFSILSTVKELEEQNKGYGFDILFSKVYSLLTDPEIRAFIDYENQSGLTFFSTFDNNNVDDNSSSSFMRKFNELNIGLHSLVEIYMFPESQHPQRTAAISKVLAKPEGLEFVSLLSKLYHRTVIEEILIREKLPVQVAQISLPSSQSLYAPQIVLKSPIYNREVSVKFEKTSPKFKNTEQIRCIMEDIQSSIGTSFIVLSNSAILASRTTITEEVKSQVLHSAEINEHLALTLVNTFFKYDVGKILSPFQSKNYYLVVLHLIDGVLSKKGPNLGANQAPFGVFFMQHEGFVNLRELCLKFWENVKSLTIEDAREYSNIMNYQNVKCNDYCITIAFIQRCLNIYSKLCSKEPYLPLKHDSDISFMKKSSLIKAFSLQCRISGFGLLIKMFEDEIVDDDINIKKLPAELYKGLIALSEKIYTTEETLEEKDGVLYPLNRQTLDIRDEQMKYLKSIGFEESYIELFLNENEITSLPKMIENVNKPEYISLASWATITVSASYNPFKPTVPNAVDFQLEGVRTVGDFYELRKEKESLVFDSWLYVAQNFSKLIEDISKLFLNTASSTYGTDNKLSPLSNMKEVLLSFDLDFENAQHDFRFKNVLKFIAGLIQRAEIVNKSVEVEDILGFLDGIINGKSSDADWFGGALEIFEKIMSTTLMPICEEEYKVKVSAIDDVYTEPIYHISDNLKERFLDAILNWKDITDLDDASAVARTLVLYLQKPEYYGKILNSHIIISLVKIVKHQEVVDAKNYQYFDEDENADDNDKRKIKINEEMHETKFRNYKLILNSLLRRCFETQDVVSRMITKLVNDVIKSGSRADEFGGGKNYNLSSFLKDYAAVVIRDPSTFRDVLSSKIILSNPQNPVYSMNVAKAPEAKTDRNPSRDETNDPNDVDAQMIDVSIEDQAASSGQVKKGVNVKPSGVMKLLLSELMSVKYNDWIIDSPDQKILYDKLKKNSKKNLKSEDKKVFRNPNHGYICYLLRVIVELLASYKESKLEFLTFSKRHAVQNTSLKPRSTALNFFLHQLVPTGVFDPNQGHNEVERKTEVFRLAKIAVLALLSTVDIDGIPKKDHSSTVPPKEDPDMLFIRKFSIDIISKALKESCESNDDAFARYGKINNIAEMCTVLLNPHFKLPVFDVEATGNDGFFICKAMIERSIPSQMASILTNIEMNYPCLRAFCRTVIKFLNTIGSLKSNYQDFLKSFSDGEEEEQVAGEDYDTNDEITQLFRNSSLGMYDVASYNSEEEVSDGYDSDSDESGIIVYSDLEDHLDEDIEEFGDESDNGSVIEVDGSIDGEIYDEDDEGMSPIEADESNDYGSEIDSDEDIEIEELGSFDEDDLSSDDSGSFISDGEIEEYSSGDDSSIIDEWVADYEEEENRRNSNARNPTPANLNHRRLLETFGVDMSNPSASRSIINLLERSVNSANAAADDNLDSINDNSDDDDDGDVDDDVNDDDDDGIDGNEVAPVRSFGRNLHNSQFLNILPDGSFFQVPNSRSRQSSDWGRGGFTESPFLISPNISGWRLERIMRPPRFSNKDTRGEFRSTFETWTELYRAFLPNDTKHAALLIIPGVVDSIFDYSKKLSDGKREKKRQEKEAQEKRKEEARKKREEEEERRRLEEEQAKAEMSVDATNEHPDIQNDINTSPVMVEIGGREVDIAGTGIDLEFLLALPLDMREEVFVQHMNQQREQESQRRISTMNTTIDPEFLDALPDQLREEILAQQAYVGGSNIFSSAVLEGDNEEESEEDATPDNDNGDEDGAQEESQESEEKLKKKKTYFTQLVDKGGVAGILRLVFLKDDTGSSTYYCELLRYLCYNKHTRSETVSLLLYILQEGINDNKSLERVFNRISNRALSLNNGNAKISSNLTVSASSAQGTLSSQNKNVSLHSLPVHITPAMVGITVLKVLNTLLNDYPHLRYYFLTEHESSIQLKRANRSKTKLKESLSGKDMKYPINILLSLIEKPIVKREPILMYLLSKAAKTATSSLAIIEKAKEKEKLKDMKMEESKNGYRENSEGSSMPKSETKKSLRPFDPPIVSNSTLSSVVSILIAGDCSTKTFQQALTTLKNLSLLSNSKQVFTAELSSFATSAGKLLVFDLKELSFAVSRADDPSLIDSEILNKFVSSSSTQNKLLRVLTALDYLFDSETEGESLKSLYEKIALGPLWGNLSECFRAIEKKKALYNIATVLLPLIESLMVVCKHSKVKDLQVKDTLKYESKVPDFANEPIESLFFSFTNEHKVILNEMIRNKPKLMSGPFSMLVRNPRILEFDNKRNYFERKLQNKNAKPRTMQIKVSRERVFLDSYRACAFKSPEEFRDSKFDISFKGEAGVDAGGVTREWYQVLARQIFNPDYALFVPVPSDESTFHPNRTSWVNSEHLSFFKFVGRIIGKAIFDGQVLDAHFSRAVYKCLLGKPVSLKDMETLDLDYAKSLKWMLENDITDIIVENFSLETEDYGEHKIVDLIPGGRDIPVTEENKQEYVKKVVEYRLQVSVKDQLDSFLEGFFQIIPKDLISIFDEQELELLISGLPDIDVDDWKNNANYNNYSPSTPVIQWFWRAVKSFDNEQKAKLLQFVTGTSKVPLQGFVALAGVNGNHKFSIHRDYGSLERLPSAHTCFNQLDLPAYESYEQLRGSLLLAITEGHEGFGFA